MLNLKEKKVTLMGLGLHGGGLAVGKWLLQEGAILTVTDLKTSKQLKTTLVELKNFAKENQATDRLKFVLGKHQPQDFESIDFVIKNPGVPRNSQWLQLAEKNNIPIHNEASLFFLFCQVPIIGITGSKGKSTTTALIGQIFKQAHPGTVVAGNIKTTPMFTIINKVRNSDSRVPFVVLELSSWQLELLDQIKKSPSTAVITNIYPEHLNTYDSIDDYAQTKFLISKFQNKSDYLVLNYDDKRLRDLAKQAKSQVIWFSRQSQVLPGAILSQGKIVWQDSEPQTIINTNKLKLIGNHNIENVLAAVAVARTHGIAGELIAEVIANFKGLKDRLEMVAEKEGRFFYNDTTATAPVAAISALKSFKQPVILIAGGSDKGLPVKELAEEINQRVKFLVLLPGNGTDKLKKILNKIGFVNFVETNSMPEALLEAYRVSESQDIILLSPGFASFGLFVHEFDRGEQFKDQIKKLAQ